MKRRPKKRNPEQRGGSGKGERRQHGSGGRGTSGGSSGGGHGGRGRKADEAGGSTAGAARSGTARSGTARSGAGRSGAGRSGAGRPKKAAASKGSERGGGSGARGSGRGSAERAAPPDTQVWLTGRNLLRETLQAGRWPLKRVLVEESGDDELQHLEQRAVNAGYAVERAPREKLDARAGHGRHQGIAALAGDFPYADLRESIARARARGEQPLVVLLDQLHDPHNVGAILRSAEVAGVTCVVMTERRQVGITSVVARTSAGAVNWLPIAQVSNLANTLERLREEEFWIFGASERGRRTVYDLDLTGATAIVIGGEGDGLRSLTQKRCDELASIPVRGRVGSLNASVAAGVFLFEAVRQRGIRPSSS